GGEARLAQRLPTLTLTLRLHELGLRLSNTSVLLRRLQLHQDGALADALAVGEAHPVHQLGRRGGEGHRATALRHAQDLDGVGEDVGLDRGRGDLRLTPEGAETPACAAGPAGPAGAAGTAGSARAL